MRLILFLLGIAAAAASAACSAPSANGVQKRAYALKVNENFTNPIGLNLDGLNFSWRLPEGCTSQTAYRITVQNLDTLETFDSKKVDSKKSVHVALPEISAKSRGTYVWRVKVWDKTMGELNWSNPARFEAGLQKNSDWRAKWIFSTSPLKDIKSAVNKMFWADGSVFKTTPPCYLRKTFGLQNKRIKKARLYVASRGTYRAYINGKPASETFWGTGWTDFNKRIQVDTFDVTNLLESGSQNAIAFILADGWYSGRLSHGERRNFYGTRPELAAQLEAEYADGSRETVSTDGSWQWAFGAVKAACIYDGETFDANAELKNWNTPAPVDQDKWNAVESAPVGGTPLLEPRRNQPITAHEVLTAKTVRKISEGAYVFDFGQNLAGTIKVDMPSFAKATLKFRYAEMTNPDGTIYTANYRLAKSTDYYICAPHQKRVRWTPSLTFHGFRYVEISGLPPTAKPDKSWIKSVALYNDTPPTGSFSCSNTKVNALQNCIVWGQKSNFFSIPTDCPQRDERLGWTGDALAFCSTAAFNADILGFFNKWTLDLRDARNKDGAPSATAPHFEPRPFGAAGWADAIVVCPWEIYKAFGDRKILEQNYPAMAQWVDLQTRHAQDFIRSDPDGYGDWLQPSRPLGQSATPKDLIATAYFAHDAYITSLAAEELGKTADQKKYAELFGKIKEAFNKKFVSADGTVKSGSQTAYILALNFNLLPAETARKAFEKLCEAVEKNGMRLDTGFIGTPLIADTFSKFGRTDISYKLLLQENYPSWLYTVNQGATTMWERWNSFSHENGFGDVSMNSFNHYAYGAIGKWLYSRVGGIDCDPSHGGAGYKRIIFNPAIDARFMTHASAALDTPYGLAESSWRISQNKVVWNVKIPPNDEGIIYIPSASEQNAQINGKNLSEFNTNAAEREDSITVPLKSGKYKISYILK